jgi:protein TonB
MPPTLVALLVAVGAHAALLLGVKLGFPPVISGEEAAGGAMLLAMEDVAGPPAAPPALALPEPPTPPVAEVSVPLPEPAPEPSVPTVPVIGSTAVMERSAPPRPPTKGGKSPVAVAPVARARAAGRVSGGAQTAGAGGAGPQAGDRAHATWRNRVTPVYPSTARAARQSGRVLVQVNVSASGQATEVRVASSSGFPALDQAALSAARASSYLPKTVAGIPQPDSLTVPYAFRLDAI